MSKTQIIYLIPYLLSLAVALWIFIYTWRHRHIPGAKAYAWLNATQTWMIIGFIFELLSPGLDEKLFWDKFQWIATSLASITIANFAIQYTETRLRRPPIFWVVVASVPVMVLLGIATDPLTHLIYTDPQIETDFFFPELQYPFTWPLYVLAFHGYAVIAFSFVLLLRRYASTHRLFRSQVLAIIVEVFLDLVKDGKI